MLFRISKYAVKNTLRNKFLSLSSVLVLTLLMFFINILVLLHDVSHTIIDGINSKMSISLYLKDWYNLNSADVTWLMDSIQSVSPVVELEYKSKDEILNDIKAKEPDLVKMLERNNPLPNTIVISNIPLEVYEKINPFIENKWYILAQNDLDTEEFSNYSVQYKKIQSVINLINLLQVGLYVIIGIFLLSIFVITYSVIWNFIYYFRDEIYITRLVGWGRQFIYWPFVIQWMIYSAIAFVFSLIIFITLLQNFNVAFDTEYVLWASRLIFLQEFIIFMLVWGMSGWLSSWKYLKK